MTAVAFNKNRTIPDTPERIAGLEASVDGFHNQLNDIRSSVDSEFRDIRTALDAIQNKLGKTRETNWMTVLTGVLVVGALYAAAIRPLERDIERARSDYNESLKPVTRETERVRSEASDIARAVLEQNKEIAMQRNELTGAKGEHAALHEAISRLDQFGSAGIAAKVSSLEAQAKNITDDFKTVQEKGSPITDRRLSLLELQVKQISDHGRL